MKNFETPELNVIALTVEDVITTSEPELGENQTPTAPPRGN